MKLSSIITVNTDFPQHFVFGRGRVYGGLRPQNVGRGSLFNSLTGDQSSGEWVSTVTLLRLFTLEVQMLSSHQELGFISGEARAGTG